MWAKYTHTQKNYIVIPLKDIVLCKNKIYSNKKKGEVDNEKILSLNLYYIWTDLKLLVK